MRKFTLLLLGVVLFATHAMAQRTVSGKVTDDKGNPIPRVSVQVKGTQVGTTTNADGNYSLVVPANGKTLIFSSVDMATQNVDIGTDATISVSLMQATKSMEEVFVVAYGAQKRES